ncbi:MAG TPA: DUF3515 domain-containing protein [Micromonospora sp.]|nr:DUF3515 domain-containing protein [Micromonospora sp.]
MDQNPTPDSGRHGGRDKTTRQAALWAALVALPLAVLSGFFVLAQFGSEPAAEAQPSPSATTPQPQSTAPVQMAAPPLAEQPATVCRALLAQLPTNVNDLAQRPVSAGPEQNVAYGDPAITLACGVPAPEVSPTDVLRVVNGVCWHPVEESHAMVFTTVDREVPVQLRVPLSYDLPLQWAAPFSTTVHAAVPAAESAPTGCTD